MKSYEIVTTRNLNLLDSLFPDLFWELFQVDFVMKSTTRIERSGLALSGLTSR